jgi:hypothetical protein
MKHGRWIVAGEILEILTADAAAVALEIRLLANIIPVK